MQDAIFEMSQLIAALTDVDGAVVMTNRFELLGFGAEIGGDLPDVQHVARALDLEAHDHVMEPVFADGTRHRSAYRLCARLAQARRDRRLAGRRRALRRQPRRPRSRSGSTPSKPSKCDSAEKDALSIHRRVLFGGDVDALREELVRAPGQRAHPFGPRLEQPLDFAVDVSRLLEDPFRAELEPAGLALDLARAERDLPCGALRTRSPAGAAISAVPRSAS